MNIYRPVSVEIYSHISRTKLLLFTLKCLMFENENRSDDPYILHKMKSNTCKRKRRDPQIFYHLLLHANFAQHNRKPRQYVFMIVDLKCINSDAIIYEMPRLTILHVLFLFNFASVFTLFFNFVLPTKFIWNMSNEFPVFRWKVIYCFLFKEEKSGDNWNWQPIQCQYEHLLKFMH